MTKEIEFSLMADSPEGIQPLLDQFEEEYKIRVRLRLLSWDSAWSMFVRSALYQDGPDVSEVGTTWIGDLIGMNALRPFSAADLAVLGKPASYFPAAWKTAVQYREAHVWSIPWLTGSRLIFYRPNLLEQAGIDPAGAFKSNEQLEKTVDRLQDQGVRFPWTVPTGYTHTTLLNIASWVWAAGGDFISSDGRATRFTEPQALAGMRSYFSLGRALAPENRHLNALQPDDFFLTNPETALTISGPWLFCRAQKQGAAGGKISAALPPGPSFVGGSNLIVWKYSRHPEAAVKLIHFLSRTATQVAYCQQIGLLPARMEALQSPPFSTDHLWKTAYRGLQNGSSFPLIRLWGLIEDRLTAGLSAVWTELLSHPGLDPLEVVDRQLTPIAQRLDRVLASA